MSDDSRIFRAADIIPLLNISAPTFFRWIREGRFPRGVKYGPNTTGWPQHVVKKWLAEKEAADTQAAQQ